MVQEFGYHADLDHSQAITKGLKTNNRPSKQTRNQSMDARDAH